MQKQNEDTEHRLVESDNGRDPSTGRFTVGNNANPYGRPRRGKTYRELAANRPDEKKLAVILAMERKATVDGTVGAAEFLRDTAEGKPTVTLIQETNETFAELMKELAAIQEAEHMAGNIVDGESRLLS